MKRESVVSYDCLDFASTNREIRTFLSHILGFTEALYDSKLTLKERLACIDKVRRSVKDITRLLHAQEHQLSLLGGSIEIHNRPFNLKRELGTTFKALQGASWRRKLDLTVESDDIPTRIFSDPLRLREILTHAIDTRIRYTSRGSILVQISHCLETSKLTFWIESCGLPFPQCDASLLGPKKEESDAPTTQPISVSSAVGITLAQSLCKALGGELNLLPGKSYGNQAVLVSLPTGPTEDIPRERVDFMSDNPDSELDEVDSSRKCNFSSVKILLVEDDPDITSLIQLFLKDTEAHVSVAQNGQEGFAKATSMPFDIILADVEMPVMNGIELTQKLRSSGCVTPILILTAHAVMAVKEQCTTAKCTAYLSKPVSRDTLLQMIQHYTKKEIREAGLAV